MKKLLKIIGNIVFTILPESWVQAIGDSLRQKGPDDE